MPLIYVESSPRWAQIPLDDGGDLKLCRAFKPAACVWLGVCDVFDLLLLHVYNTFSNVGLPELFPPHGQVGSGPMSEILVRASHS